MYIDNKDKDIDAIHNLMDFLIFNKQTNRLDEILAEAAVSCNDIDFLLSYLTATVPVIDRPEIQKSRTSVQVASRNALVAAGYQDPASELRGL